MAQCDTDMSHTNVVPSTAYVIYSIDLPLAVPRDVLLLGLICTTNLAFLGIVILYVSIYVLRESEDVALIHK